MANKKNNAPVDEMAAAKERVNKKMKKIQDATQPDLIKKGVVHDCSALNVRKSPRGDATVLMVISKDAPLKIDTSKSTSNFYKVITESGVEGFCMKKYVKVKK